LFILVTANWENLPATNAELVRHSRALTIQEDLYPTKRGIKAGTDPSRAMNGQSSRCDHRILLNTSDVFHGFKEDRGFIGWLGILRFMNSSQH
jgi:hypothetical protein